MFIAVVTYYCTKLTSLDLSIRKSDKVSGISSRPSFKCIILFIISNFIILKFETNYYISISAKVMLGDMPQLYIASCYKVPYHPNQTEDECTKTEQQRNGFFFCLILGLLTTVIICHTKSKVKLSLHHQIKQKNFNL